MPELDSSGSKNPSIAILSGSPRDHLAGLVVSVVCAGLDVDWKRDRLQEKLKP
jgi:hypothetical protein